MLLLCYHLVISLSARVWCVFEIKVIVTPAAYSHRHLDILHYMKKESSKNYIFFINFNLQMVVVPSSTTM